MTPGTDPQPSESAPAETDPETTVPAETDPETTEPAPDTADPTSEAFRWVQVGGPLETGSVEQGSLEVPLDLSLIHI